MNNPTDQTRKEFEEWITKLGKGLRIDCFPAHYIPAGIYMDGAVQLAYEAYLEGNKKSEDTFRALISKALTEIGSYHIDWAKLNTSSPDYDKNYKPEYPAIYHELCAAIATNQPKEGKK